MDTINLKIVFIFTAGFALASLFGYFSNKMKLSPILGYLIAGYLIGPFAPGYVADLKITEQLAEVGVILMMFSVGLHFKWQDLLKVKWIAIPGALGQTVLTTLLTTWLVFSFGQPIELGVTLGLSIGVSSTMVLARVLLENNLLDTPEGHISLGWTIVEDIITVAVLLLLPTISASLAGERVSFQEISISLSLIILKFILLSIVMFTIGIRFAKFVLGKIIKADSHELFTLTILAITFVIATSATLIFGVSIALGAFISGIVVGQTNVKHKVSQNALPLKDTFVVIFFISVGMLFNPSAVAANFSLFLGILVIILVCKPLAAFLITLILKRPFKTALTVAIAIGQIGELTFVMAEEASNYNLLVNQGFDILIACALVSISLNPLLFRLFSRVHL